MRKETTNTFSEGIIGDLNPINMPSNALTDCLNGTVITYDGNELSLQNDKGNYALKNCRLKEGFVPVGIQEYGGIIYIVSYNPQTNKAEIGSYPTISKIYEAGKDLPDISKNSYTLTDVSTYSGFCSKNPFTVLIGSGKDEDWLINPGDEITITADVPPKPLFYKYFIMDSDQNVTDVTNDLEDKIGNKIRSPWKKAGWLAYRASLPEIADFQVNVKSLVRKVTNNDVTYAFDIDVEVDSDVDLSNYLSIEVDEKLGENNPNSGTLSGVNKETLPNGRVLYSFIYSNSDPITINTDDIFKISFTPKITVTKDGHTYPITYDDNTITLTINGSTTVGLNDIKIAEEEFWYYIDKNNKKITFYFSSSNVDEIGLANGEFSLHYAVSKRNWDPEGTVGENGESGNWIEIIGDATASDFNQNGRGSFSIPIVDFTNDIDSLFSEDYYKIKMWLTGDSSDSEGEINDGEEKIIYIAVSEIIKYPGKLWGFSDEETLFNYELPIEDYLKTVKILSKSLSFTETSGSTTSFTATPDDKYKKWIAGTNFCGGRYSRAFDEEQREYLGKGFDIDVSVSIQGTYSLTLEASILAGPMWKSLLEDGIVMQIDGAEETLKFDEYTGLCDESLFIGGEDATHNLISKIPCSFVLRNNTAYSGYDYKVIDTLEPWREEEVIRTKLALNSGSSGMKLSISPPFGSPYQGSRYIKTNPEMDTINSLKTYDDKLYSILFTEKTSLGIVKIMNYPIDPSADYTDKKANVVAFYTKPPQYSVPILDYGDMAISRNDRSAKSSYYLVAPMRNPALTRGFLFYKLGNASEAPTKYNYIINNTSLLYRESIADPVKLGFICVEEPASGNFTKNFVTSVNIAVVYNNKEYVKTDVSNTLEATITSDVLSTIITDIRYNNTEADRQCGKLSAYNDTFFTDSTATWKYEIKDDTILLPTTGLINALNGNLPSEVISGVTADAGTKILVAAAAHTSTHKEYLLSVLGYLYED